MKGIDKLPFERRVAAGGRTVLWVRKGYGRALQEAGIDRPESLLPSRPTRSPGRGPVGFFPLEGHAGEQGVLKRYRRGGWAGKVFPDRFAGARGFLLELRTAETAIRSGIPVPLPLGLVCRGPAGLRRVYGITRRIAGARTLVEFMDVELPQRRKRDLIRAAARTVRAAQDGGLDHRDLNLGNLLVSGTGSGFRVHLVDLIGSRLRRSLPWRRRIGALKRLRRSWEKQLHLRRRTSGPELHLFLLAYAGGDRKMKRALRRWSRWDRVLLAVHRFGWRRPG